MGDPDALRRSLGLKPRGAPRAASARGAPSPPPEADERAEPITDPVKKPVGKLPPDAQRLLRAFYIARPTIDLPPHLHALEGSWGRFLGDGRPDREVAVGLRPGFVLFVHPLYPGDGPKWVTKRGSREGELVDPGLHDQPPLTERGFVPPETCNRLGEQCVYICWKHDGIEKTSDPAHEEATAPAGENPRDARRRVQLEKRKRDLEERRARAASRRR